MLTASIDKTHRIVVKNVFELTDFLLLYRELTIKIDTANLRGMFRNLLLCIMLLF